MIKRYRIVIRGIVQHILLTAILIVAARTEGVTFQDMGRAFAPLPEVKIYTAKKFITMDSARPEAEAVAVMGEKILAVGSLDELTKATKGQPYKVDHTFDGYTDGHKGEWMMEPDLYAKAFRKYWDAGYMIVTHVTGDGGLDMMLDNLEINMRRNPRYDHRTTAVHFGVAQPDQIARIKRLGAIVSGNPYYVTALADNYAQNGMTPERVKRMVPMADVEKAGIHFSYHSDMPMAPAQPLFLMDCGVNRISTSGKVSTPEQRVTRMGALKAVTIEAAYSWRMEEQIGSIEPGKLANFTVLEENPLTVDPLKIKDIKVWGTMLEGEVLPVKAVVQKQEKVPSGDVTTTFHPVKMQKQSHSHTAASAEDAHIGCVCHINKKMAMAMIAQEKKK